MSSPSGKSIHTRSWRDIHQDIAPRAMSREGRKRLAMATIKSISIVVVLGVSVWAGYEILRTWQANPAKLRAPVKGEPVKAVTMRTDGVLDLAWAGRVLALPKGAGLMELDLFALRDRLLSDPQVRTAVVARKFPATLTVVIEERTPVARIIVQTADQPATPYLVARDGVVFAGTGFSEQLTGRLPYLDGVKLKRAGTGFAPIEGMVTVADLLGRAQTYAPERYETWRVVSLAKFTTDGTLVVTSTEVPEIVFGTREDFLRLIAQLDHIVRSAREHPERPALRSVNLAVGGSQVPVALVAPLSIPGANARAVTPARPGMLEISPARTHPLRSTPQRPSAYFQPQRSSPL